MLNVIPKSFRKTKILLKSAKSKVVGLRLRYKIISAAAVALCAGAIVVTVVIAQPNSAPKIATVAHETTTSAQKVKAADTAKAADQPAAPAASTTKTPATTPASSTATPQSSSYACGTGYIQTNANPLRCTKDPNAAPSAPIADVSATPASFNIF